MKKPKQLEPANTPESWQVPEAESKRVWDKKSQQFQDFKERFRKRFDKISGN